ncbi:hypothetical protein [Deinococcus sp. Leaf326]|uniref:hypothetical protein n=1 Tax=Deinococcus sp. Leaf326 TaxID=1736338 RepID=UPI0006F3A756|nr:hypothetical protein [Deinococcus sp. Leaf326]KQR04542.1 hypothetical protein ASF71_10920 [Deinococcus sp. Leaf326]
MKKMFLSLLALGAVSSASAATSLGGSIGSGAALHYQVDNDAVSSTRFGLNLDATNFNFNTLSLGGTVDYLRSAAPGSLGGLNPYYGLGLGAGVSLGGTNAVSVYPHVLGGLSYNVTAPLSVFGELNAGPSITVGSNTSVFFGIGARIGVNYVIGN